MSDPDVQMRRDPKGKAALLGPAVWCQGQAEVHVTVLSGCLLRRLPRPAPGPPGHLSCRWHPEATSCMAAGQWVGRTAGEGRRSSRRARWDPGSVLVVTTVNLSMGKVRPREGY